MELTPCAACRPAFSGSERLQLSTRGAPGEQDLLNSMPKTTSDSHALFKPWKCFSGKVCTSHADLMPQHVCFSGAVARVLLFNATGERDSAAMLKLLVVSTATLIRRRSCREELTPINNSSALFTVFFFLNFFIFSSDVSL